MTIAAPRDEADPPADAGGLECYLLGSGDGDAWAIVVVCGDWPESDPAASAAAN